MASAHIILEQRDKGGPYLSERAKHAMAVSISFTLLATCSVVARLYTRARIVKRMEPNDWMSIIALVSVRRPSNFLDLIRRK